MTEQNVHQIFWWMKIKDFVWENVKLGKIFTKTEIFLETVGKSETERNASLPQRRWTPLSLSTLEPLVSI